MKIEQRWMAQLRKEAAACTTKLPWQRGAMRKAMIARRKTDQEGPPVRQHA